ncbi:SRPBCC family protein [Nocardia gipuzkoensis]
MRTCTDIHSIIDASPARVMDALVAVERLPEWSPSYSNVRIADYDNSAAPPGLRPCRTARQHRPTDPGIRMEP